MSDEEWIDMADRSRTEGSGFAAMPDAARNIVDRSEQLSGISVVCVGVGPDRKASLARKGGPFDIAWGEATF